MSICNENIKPIVFSEEIATENIKKKYGLFPINDINPTVNICSEIFEGPEYYTNLTKLNTGLTENSIGVFNITNTGMTANFVFTGNTDTLTAYTGYFEYNLYERSLDLQVYLSSRGCMNLQLICWRQKSFGEQIRTNSGRFKSTCGPY